MSELTLSDDGIVESMFSDIRDLLSPTPLPSGSHEDSWTYINDPPSFSAPADHYMYSISSSISTVSPWAEALLSHCKPVLPCVLLKCCGF